VGAKQPVSVGAPTREKKITQAISIRVSSSASYTEIQPQKYLSRKQANGNQYTALAGVP
jgi:hypothetical protein